MTSQTQHCPARCVEDAAWDLKDAAADLIGRPLSDADKATLASVQRDLERLHERLVEVRDRRRRRRNGAASPQVPDDDSPQQEPVAP